MARWGVFDHPSAPDKAQPRELRVAVLASVERLITSALTAGPSPVAVRTNLAALVSPLKQDIFGFRQKLLSTFGMHVDILRILEKQQKLLPHIEQVNRRQEKRYKVRAPVQCRFPIPKVQVTGVFLRGSLYVLITLWLPAAGLGVTSRLK